MVQEPGTDPVEIGVLAALMSGTATVDDLALRTKQPSAVVQLILDRAVAEQTVNRIALTRSAEYSLTPEGLYLVGRHPGAPEAGAGHADLGSPTPSPVMSADAAADLTGDRGVVDEPPPSPSAPVPVHAAQTEPQTEPQPEPKPQGGGRRRPKVVKRHVVYAVGYVVVGLFLLLIQPVIGLLAVLGGVVLGAVALRPLTRSGATSTTDARPEA